MHYLKIKRARVGKCNICGEPATLSWDHVPPKGGIEVTPVEQTSLLQQMGVDGTKVRPSVSQNGLKFRTVCQQCNSLAGREYDPSLNQIGSTLGGYLKSGMALPRTISLSTMPNRVAKAILFHLLAAKGSLDNSVFDEKLRPCVLDVGAPVPLGICVFYWVFPYNVFSVRRDILMPRVRGRLEPVAMFNLLKYFPLAFLATDAEAYEDLAELTILRGGKTDDRADIPINLAAFHEADWPDKVDDGNFIVGGQTLESAIDAVPRATDKRKTV